MSHGALRLTNDDEPGSLKPRKVEVIREGLRIGEQPAVVALVIPPLDFDVRVERVVLSSRTMGVPVGDVIQQAAEHPGRVFVSRYIGQIDPIPDQLTRQDLEILFWGRLEAISD